MNLLSEWVGVTKNKWLYPQTKIIGARLPMFYWCFRSQRKAKLKITHFIKSKKKMSFLISFYARLLWLIILWSHTESNWLISIEGFFLIFFSKSSRFLPHNSRSASQNRKYLAFFGPFLNEEKGLCYAHFYFHGKVGLKKNEGLLKNIQSGHKSYKQIIMICLFEASSPCRALVRSSNSFGWHSSIECNYQPLFTLRSAAITFFLLWKTHFFWFRCLLSYPMV